MKRCSRGILLWSRLGLTFITLLADAPSALAGGAQPYERAAASTVRLPNQVPVVGYGLRNAFPEVSFDQPIALAAPPMETNRLLVAQRTGLIYVITNLAQPTKTLFLDLSWQLESAGVESGLLGLTFHPGFATNGFFYVYRTMLATTAGAANRFHDVVSRFSVSPLDPNRARPESELPLLVHYDQADTHNGGDLKFGPDGYLYISIGERFDRDVRLPEQTPLDRDLHGSIVRIDVDRRPGNPPPNPHPASTPNYSIPVDNPFIGATRHHGLAVDPGQVRTELYATGFRNPWRLAFDPFTGDLYVGDVGEESREEVNLVSRGADYGWPYREGTLVTAYSPPVEFHPVAPLHAYGRGRSGGTNGSCVIGGVVYAGQAMPWLRGRYLFADHRSGYIWALARQGSGSTVETLMGASIGFSSFGTDPRDGEVLLTHVSEGAIYRLFHVAPENAIAVPPTLADTGLFADLTALTPNAGVVPYDVNVSFWSDDARKSRWFCVPELERTMAFSPTTAWGFPTGAVWVKHFELELVQGVAASARRLETRVLVNTAEGFYGLTYRWGDSRTNAWLVPSEGLDERFIIRNPTGSIVREQSWRYPARAECMNCHTKQSGRVLGFNTAQLNRTANYGGIQANQIQALTAAGYLDPVPEPEAELPALAAANALDCPLEFRVRSYLQANCSACHVPAGPPLTLWDARLATPLSDAHIIGEVIMPGSLVNSTLYLRLLNLLPLMPPIGATLQNTNGQNLVADWILRLPPAPWSYGSIGDVLHPGGSTVSNGVYHVGGTGKTLAGTNDAFQFLHQSFPDTNAQLIVRLVSTDSGDPAALAGLMFRSGTGRSDRFVLAGCRGNGQATMFSRAIPGAAGLSAGSQKVDLPQWLRLVRRPSEVEAWRSDDGVQWLALGTIPWAGSAPLEAGLAVNSGSSTKFNNAIFDSLSSLSITLTSRIPAFLRQPANLTLGASVRRTGRELGRVEYYDGASKVGETFAEPHVLTVSNLWSGTHELTVRAVDVDGAAVASAPAPLTVRPFPTLAGILGQEAGHEGGPGHRGAQGYVIPTQETNLPPYVDLAVRGATDLIWALDTLDPRALHKAGTGLGVATAWTAPGEFTVSLGIRNGQLQRLSLYFVDWDTAGDRVQRVDFVDPDSGRVVVSEALNDFTGGVYLSAFVRGNVEVRVVTLAGPGAVLSGVFLDDYPHELPGVAVVNPVEGSSLELPAALALEADAWHPSGEIQRVQYYLDGKLVAIRTNAPYRASVPDLTEGIHTVVARAYDPLYAHMDSVPVTFTAKPPVPKAIFLREDATTRGNWVSRYGAVGWLLPPLTNRWPPGLSQAIGGATFFDSYSTSADYLQLPNAPDSPNRILPLSYSYSAVSYDLGLTDGHPRQVALYFHDDADYTQIVSVLNQSTGQLLDTRTVTNGWGGRYLVWIVQGNVSLVISNAAPGAVLSRVNALFLDSFTNTPPDIALLAPAAGLEVWAPARILLSASAFGAEGIREIQFHTAQAKLGEVREPPHDFVWEYPAAGTFEIFARAISVTGAFADSPSIPVTVRFATPARARFVGTDLVRGGNWAPIYGNEGYWLPGSSGAKLLPPSVQIVTDQAWEQYHDQIWPKALRLPGEAIRLLSFWLGPNWRFRTAFPDGRPHRLTLYNYAPRWTNSATIRLRPTGSGAVLDVREVPNQDQGTYLTWELEGDITFEIIQPDYSTAFINAIFVDPVADLYGDWRRRFFPPADQVAPNISGESADPDSDGYNNWAESLLGRNPTIAETHGPLWIEHNESDSRVHWLSAKAAAPDAVRMQSSRDLKTWQDDPGVTQVDALDRGEQIERVYSIPQSAAQPWFFRLRLNAP